MSHRMTFVLAAAALFAVISGSATAQSFEGRKKCSSCHKSQAESWGETAHAKAMDSLKPGTKEEAKKKAEEAKKELSESSQVELNEPFIAMNMDTKAPVHLNMRLTRRREVS